MDNDIEIGELRKLLWAKSEPFKPLLVHLLEIGAVAQTLISESVFYPVLLELEKRTTLSKSQVINLVGYLASVHDIGKIHPSFVGNGAIPSIQKTLEEFQLQYRVERFRHEKYGEFRLKKIWEEKQRFQDRRLRRNLSAIIKYHHQGKRGELGRMSPDNELIWKILQEEYEKILFLQFNPPCEFTVTHMDAVCMSLLGILIASDWIASGDDFANTTVNLPNDEIVSNASALARIFLKRNQMLHQDAFGAVTSFTDLWEFIPRTGMRPLQVEAEKVFEDIQEKPLAAIIEAPMGEGKTEAAVYMATQLAKRWNKEGFYVALPTAATSNQMFSRINKMLRHLNLRNAKLMHAVAWLIDNSTGINFNGEDSVEAKLWTAPMRRGLISPFSVGTVDQVMMAVMRTKYGVLRLSGLEQKVLIIDELHSYDAYMSAIITTLLKWCAVLHVPVIMLSATLPADKKEEFGSCYTKDVTAINRGLYPVITLFYEDKPARQIAVQGSHQKLEIKVESRPWLNQLNLLVPFVKEKIEKEGGCYCILRNTVQEAQNTYLSLKKALKDIPVLLFHARFTAKRRQELEQKCIECFGSNNEKRSEKLILVATQVVEQSLDLDFDYLVTDICPIDLLLQRAGRLWRHNDTPRPKGNEPQMTVLIPAGNDYGLTGMIYADVILDRTRNVLKGRDTFSLPADIPDLVEQVYDEQELDNVSIEKWFEYKTDEIIKQSAATIQMLNEPDEKHFYFSESDDIFFSDDEDKFLSVKTRLGEPTVKLALLPEELFKKAVEQRIPIKTVEEILLYSVSVAEKKVAFLYSCKDDPKVIKGTGLLNGMFLLNAVDGCCTVQDGHKIIMDNDLGLVIKEVGE